MGNSNNKATSVYETQCDSPSRRSSISSPQASPMPLTPVRSSQSLPAITNDVFIDPRSPAYDFRRTPIRLPRLDMVEDDTEELAELSESLIDEEFEENQEDEVLDLNQIDCNTPEKIKVCVCHNQHNKY
jgi:hypothetical protein